MTRVYGRNAWCAGGLLVEHPELSVGVVRAVCRPTGLQLELLARRPLSFRLKPVLPPWRAANPTLRASAP
jgi:hypothetical protein